jgi:hypothetical protein
VGYGWCGGDGFGRTSEVDDFGEGAANLSTISVNLAVRRFGESLTSMAIYETGSI